jgi:hypothetical protein
MDGKKNDNYNSVANNSSVKYTFIFSLLVIEAMKQKWYLLKRLNISY